MWPAQHAACFYYHEKVYNLRQKRSAAAGLQPIVTQPRQPKIRKGKIWKQQHVILFKVTDSVSCNIDTKTLEQHWKVIYLEKEYVILTFLRQVLHLVLSHWRSHWKLRLGKYFLPEIGSRYSNLNMFSGSLQRINSICKRNRFTYRIFVVKVDGEAKRPGAEGFTGGKAVLKGSLSVWFHQSVQLDCSELN